MAHHQLARAPILRTKWKIKIAAMMLWWRSITFIHLLLSSAHSVCIAIAKNKYEESRGREIRAGRLTRYALTPKLYGTMERETLAQTSIDWIERNRNRNRFEVIHFSQRARNGGGGGADAFRCINWRLLCVCCAHSPRLVSFISFFLFAAVLFHSN